MDEWIGPIADFFKSAGLWGSLAYLAGFGIFLFLLELLVHRTKNFPHKIGEVVYYSGHRNLVEMKGGRLVIGRNSINFQSHDLTKEYFKILFSDIVDVSVENPKFGLFAEFTGISAWNFSGAVQRLIIECKVENGQTEALKFFSRNKENHMGTLKGMIQERMRSK